MASAGSAGLSDRKRPESSSAKCMASHIEPPLPQLISLPLLLKASTISAAAFSMAKKFFSSAIKEVSTS